MDNLIAEWTRKGMSSAYSDDERAIYMACAEQLHEHRHLDIKRQETIKKSIEWLNKCFKYVPDCPWRDELRDFLSENS